MGVASLDASERFGTTASQLSTLAVLQLVVYASMQVPVGILLDRHGPRRMLTTGAAIMALGQLVVAIAPTLEVAVLGRMLVGMGDAFTFISMIRLANNWLSGKRASITQQWLATIGQTGQIASAVPFALLLHTTSWETAFLALSAIGFMITALVFIGVWDDQARRSSMAPKRSGVLLNINSALADKAVPLGFWTHFSTQASGTMFALLWGVPFMIGGQGFTAAEASSVLTIFVVVNAIAGLIIGWTVANHPNARRPLVRWVVISIILAWSAAAAYEGPLPYLAVCSLVALMGIGGPASMIAFDFSRSYVAKENLGISNGIINVGGFLACFVMLFLVGIALDFQHAMDGEALYSTLHFRFAMATQLIVLIIGLYFFERSANRHAASLAIRK
jgi:MFS family permease